MKLFLAIALALSILGNTPAVSTDCGDVYTADMKVIAVSQSEYEEGQYEIDAVSEDGNVFCFLSYDPYYEGEDIGVLLDDCGTSTVTDDVIVEVF